MNRQHGWHQRQTQNRLAKKAFGLSMDLTTQQKQVIVQTELQTNNLLKFIEQKKSIENKQKVEQLTKNITNKSYLMQKINHYIYEIAQRNGAIDANYALFLMLLYLTIQQIVINIFPSQNLLSAQKFMFVKLQTHTVKRQVSQSLYYEFMTVVLRKQKITTETIHFLMGKIMKVQRQICIAIFPYYFNLFAMVLNKQIIFNDRSEQKLIPYSFQITTDNRYKGAFTRLEAFKQMRRVQKLTIEKYHCPDL